MTSPKCSSLTRCPVVATWQVDLSEINSVPMYAAFLVRTLATLLVTGLCVSMIAYRVESGRWGHLEPPDWSSRLRPLRLV